ncbi:hypothetical protein ACEQ8H_004627 [Pleosporales sp. CAS-2024a]
MTPERMRTGIIVSIVIGTIAILILVFVLLKRRRNRGIKQGKIRRRSIDAQDPRRIIVDKDLEIGIVSEPLPVYAKEAKENESVIAGSEQARQ